MKLSAEIYPKVVVQFHIKVKRDYKTIMAFITKITKILFVGKNIFYRNEILVFCFVAYSNSVVAYSNCMVAFSYSMVA